MRIHKSIISKDNIKLITTKTNTNQKFPQLDISSQKTQKTQTTATFLKIIHILGLIYEKYKINSRV